MPDENQVVEPEALLAEAEADLAALETPETEEAELGETGETEIETPVAEAPVDEGPDEDTQAFFNNLQRLTQTQAEQFRAYDPETDDLVQYTSQSAAHAAQQQAHQAFLAQQAFNMMIERVPEGIRSDVRSLVASDMGAMSTPMNVAQAIATAVGMKLLSGNTTKKTTTTATAPKAQRQVGPTASPTGASRDHAYQSFLKAFGETEKTYPYSRWKADGVR